MNIEDCIDKLQTLNEEQRLPKGMHLCRPRLGQTDPRAIRLQIEALYECIYCPGTSFFTSTYSFDYREITLFSSQELKGLYQKRYTDAMVILKHLINQQGCWKLVSKNLTMENVRRTEQWCDVCQKFKPEERNK